MDLVGSLFGEKKKPEEKHEEKEEVKDAEQDKEMGEEAESASWAVHLGVVTIGSDGVKLKPQMKVGAETSNFSTEFGLSDVRDGIKVAAVAEAKLDVHAEGTSVNELHRNIKCDTVGFKQALEIAKNSLSTGDGAQDKEASQLPKLAEVLGLDMASLKRMLGQGTVEDAKDESNNEAKDDRADNVERPLMQLRVEGSFGVGASAEVRLGWTDTDGYKMIGCAGSAAAGLQLSADAFAGKHCTGTSAKIILGIGNFLFEYTFPLHQQESVETA